MIDLGIKVASIRRLRETVELLSGQILLHQGTAALPPLSFIDDPNTGIRNPDNLDNIDIIIGGVARYRFSSSWLNILSDTIGIRFGAGIDVQLNRDGPDTLRLRCNANAQTIVLGQGNAALAAGRIQQGRDAAAAFAPGAGFGMLRWETGTNAGTLKLVAYSGTSSTGVTIVDNVGAGN